MKKILLLAFVFILNFSAAFAITDDYIKKEQDIQKKINDVGVTILNANRINKKIIFTYTPDDYKKTLNDPAITRRQIIFYDNYFKYTENDDELAGFLAHQISRAQKSYDAPWGGVVSSAQIKAAPKKYEIFSDKRAVDYMVKAGYNPLGLITLINKSTYDGLFDSLFHNSPTKRMSVIYEHIYFNYPYFLKNNTYITNKNYQNFLLTTAENRQLLEEKIRKRSRRVLKYE